MVDKTADQVGKETSTRDSDRAKLLASGLLDTSIRVPKDVVLLSDAELVERGRLAPGATPSKDLIREDRDSR